MLKAHIKELDRIIGKLAIQIEILKKNARTNTPLKGNVQDSQWICMIGKEEVMRRKSLVLAGLCFTGVLFLKAAPGSGEVTASVTGTGEINYRHVGTSHTADNTEDSLSINDVMIYITGKVSDEVDYFSEFIVQPRSIDEEVGEAHDETVQVERLYLTSSRIIPSHSIKAGLFQLFDGPIKDYHIATNNPLPGDIIFFKNPWADHGTLHDIFTDVGISIGGMRPPLGYTVAVFNGMGERSIASTDYEDARPRGFFTKLLFIPPTAPNLSIAGMYYSGEATQEEAWGSESDEYLIPEVIYRLGKLQLLGMYLVGTQTRGEDTDADGIDDEEFDNKGDGFVFQASFKITDKLSVIGRYQDVNVDDPEEMEFFGAGAHHETGDISQFELGINYRAFSRLWLKLSAQFNDESGEDTRGDRILGQIAFAF